MKKTLSLALAVLAGTFAFGQDLPQPSPSATVTQRVGLTDVTINYSRPGVKGREIFGTLVPYEQLWRTGANKATSISFSTKVMVGDKEVGPGTYSLFTIPGKDNWVIILNTETELWGVDGYNDENDVVRFKTEASTGAARESMSISVEDVTNSGASIVIAWDETTVSFPIAVHTSEMAMANIEKALEENPEDWRVFRNAANYYHQNDLDPSQALDYMKRSVELNQDNWYSHFLYAQILAGNGKKSEARSEAEKALQMGTKAAEESGQEFTYGGMIEGFMSGLE